MGQISFYANGQMWRRWDDSAQTYTEWDQAGTLVTARSYTASETAAAGAGAAAAQLVANQSTIQASIQSHLNQLETWLAANPNGAVLTAAQTAVLARMLVGVGRLLLNLTSTVGQAT